MTHTRGRQPLPDPSVDDAAHPRMSRWAVGLPVLIVLAMLVGLGIASGWLPSLVLPRKVVVVGNAIVPAGDLIAATGQTGGDNIYKWWRAVRKLDQDQVRWLDRAQPGLGWGRTLVVRVAEQRPVLYVKAADCDYWLCDDYRLVPVDAADTHEVFKRIKQLPQVELETPADELSLSLAEGIMTVVACLQQTLPGIISVIKADVHGELWCYDKQGFAIKLGVPEQLAEKVGALPKALRICAAERRQLQYLDASDPQMFYQRWQEPPQT